MAESEDEYEKEEPFFKTIQETILRPIYVLTSPALLRTYLRTILLLFTSVSLFAVAVVAYTTFYYTYIPAQGLSVEAFLKYSHLLPPETELGQSTRKHSRNGPYAFVLLNGPGKSELATRQKYDVIVELELPRSKRNLQAGNWMVMLDLIGSGLIHGPSRDYSLGENVWWETTKLPIMEGDVTERDLDTLVTARSTRPALLPQRSLITELASRVIGAPLYVLGIGQEVEILKVRMMEGVDFPDTPSMARLELRSSVLLEVYKSRVKFVARFEGLRYIMYNYRIMSFLFFTTLFWGAEVIALIFTWATISLVFSSSAAGSENHPSKLSNTSPVTPKTETEVDQTPITPASPSFSDTSRTFPTLPSQPHLHYASQSSSRVKREPETPRLEDIPIKMEEADDEDEDEDADFVLSEPGARGISLDSGIGTGSEGPGLGLVRKRSSRSRLSGKR